MVFAATQFQNNVTPEFEFRFSSTSSQKPCFGYLIELLGTKKERIIHGLVSACVVLCSESHKVLPFVFASELENWKLLNTLKTFGCSDLSVLAFLYFEWFIRT